MDEIMRMVLQIEGQAKVKDLTDQLKIQEQQMLDLIGQYKAGQLTLNQYTSSMQAAAAVAVPLSQDIDKLQGASRNLGLGALSASYAFQDFTAVLSGGGGFARALSSVQNNVPLLLASLGVGAGLTGVVSAASVAVGLLIDNFGSLAKALGADTSVQDKIDQLGKLKEASDKASESLGKQIEAMRNAEQAGPAGAGEIAKAAIQQQGGVDATVSAVTSQMISESPAVAGRRQQLQDAQAKVDAMVKAARAGGAGDAGALAAARREVEAARQEVNLAESSVRQYAQRTIIGAGQGNQQDIGELARRFPGGAFGQATVAGMAEADAFEQDMLVDQPDRTRRGGEARRRGRRLVEDLNKQGEANTKDINRTIDTEDRERQQRDAQARRFAEQQDRAASRRFNANPDFSPSRLKQMDQMQFARDEIRQLAKAAEDGVIGWDQANQQIGTLQQELIQLKAQLDNSKQGQRKIETRMGRLR